MNTRIVMSLAAALLMSTGLATAGFAQNAPIDPGHPRVNEVDTRLADQQKRIDAGVASGEITQKQAARDEKADAKIAQKASADEAKNGGHLTKAEDRHLNKRLNKNSKRIHRQRHDGKPAPAGQ